MDRFLLWVLRKLNALDERLFWRRLGRNARGLWREIGPKTKR